MHGVQDSDLLNLSLLLDSSEMTGDDEFSVVVFEVPDHTLVHRLSLTRRVRWQEQQGHIFQAFHFRVCRAVVHDHCTLSSLSLTPFVEFDDPVLEDLAGHPGFLVGVVLRWVGFDVVEAPWLGRLAEDQQRAFVCAGHVGTNESGYSFFTLFTTVTIFVFELECLIWQTTEEDAGFVGIIDIIR